MTKWLLVAEADQIQDFVFRAAHLQEVVGGSLLLSRFCREVPQHLLAATNNAQSEIIIQDGGKFVVIFDDKTTAEKFGSDLAETYRRIADGSLTSIVVQISEATDSDEAFKQAISDAEEKLRQVKRSPQPNKGITVHLPYIALCSSCGVGLGIMYDKIHDDDPTERAKYLCRACRTKAEERRSTIQNENEEGNFLGHFKRAVGDLAINKGFATRPRHISMYDPRRRYVAYLVADGNDLGQLFADCDAKTMKKVSQQMSNMLYKCLAEPTRSLIETQDKVRQSDKLPVLPLILGGDDVFVLLPGPWALSFVYRFCQNYEQQMAKVVNECGLKATPTITAAVVICKETYPHTLAHEAGSERLKQAKALSKAFAHYNNIPVSVIDFEIIGSGPSSYHASTSKSRGSLKPYLVASEQHPLPDEAKAWGLDLNTLLHQRLHLAEASIPRKRLSQLRQLFDQLDLEQIKLDDFSQQMNKILTRIRKISSSQVSQALEDAVQSLGGPKTTQFLHSIERVDFDENNWTGHGLPDLLNVWDFTYQIDIPRMVYEE